MNIGWINSIIDKHPTGDYQALAYAVLRSPRNDREYTRSLRHRINGHTTVLLPIVPSC